MTNWLSRVMCTISPVERSCAKCLGQAWHVRQKKSKKNNKLSSCSFQHLQDRTERNIQTASRDGMRAPPTISLPATVGTSAIHTSAAEAIIRRSARRIRWLESMFQVENAMCDLRKKQQREKRAERREREKREEGREQRGKSAERSEK